MMLRAPTLPSPLPDAGDALRILPLSDLHLGARPSATERLIANSDYFRRMDYVVLLGDMTGSYGRDDEYSALEQFIQKLPHPYAAINGNHEFYFEVHEPGSRIWREASLEDKAAQLEKFRRFFGLEKLWSAQRNQFGTFVFLGLDDIAQRKPETLSAPQIEFLETRLRESRGEPVYIFCHAPLYLDRRLDMEYYDSERTACVELVGELRALCESRRAPLFWISGHIHLRPDHYLFPAYEIKSNVWQIHCPDSWGYSRWAREHLVPQHHESLFSRHLEITREKLVLVTHDHSKREDIALQAIEFGALASRS